MTERKLEKVVIKSLAQLKMTMKSFMAVESKDIKITTEMKWQDDKGTVKSKVTANSRELSSRQVLLDGFKLVKTRMDLVEKAKNDVDEDEDDDELLPERLKWQLFDVNAQRFHIDRFIEQRLDGKRKGLRIEWSLTEGVFQYDPFENKLYKVDD